MLSKEKCLRIFQILTGVQYRGRLWPGCDGSCSKADYIAAIHSTLEIALSSYSILNKKKIEKATDFAILRVGVFCVLSIEPEKIDASSIRCSEPEKDRSWYLLRCRSLLTTMLTDNVRSDGIDDPGTFVDRIYFMDNPIFQRIFLERILGYCIDYFSLYGLQNVQSIVSENILNGMI